VEFRILLDDDIEPDPFLVAAQKVTTADLMKTALLHGWLSGDSDRWLGVAVPWQRGDRGAASDGAPFRTA
jgi:hypothetical protein